jgi:hypothetical protein
MAVEWKEQLMSLGARFNRLMHWAAETNPAREDRWHEDYGKTSWMILCESYNRQRKCNHEKGLGMRSSRKDYNVSLHRFPTGEWRIRCLYNCGFEVWNRPNVKFKWAHGMKMVDKSTNHLSMSQVQAPQDRVLRDIQVVAFDVIK